MNEKLFPEVNENLSSIVLLVSYVGIKFLIIRKSMKQNGVERVTRDEVKTLGDLHEFGWVSRSVKDEMRSNLIRLIKINQQPFKGILGYEHTVMPQIQQAILAKHDFILLGLRGQGKTKLLRQLIYLLDDYMPIVEGSVIQDDPFRPLSRYAVDKINDMGMDTPIAWVSREARFSEKLATPDTTVSDIIGDIDPIKAASQKLDLSHEESINFGLIPRSNRGIFIINELPDLQPRIQVALLNIMQERDIQIRGFKFRMPLDICMAFSANPEDYTNRGNIITPLKDRIDAQIITHYPKSLATAMEITSQESWADRDSGVHVSIPDVFRHIIDQIAFEARESEYIDQKSGVSSRMSITAMEQMVSAAERRAFTQGVMQTNVRISDVYHVIPALTGKLELVYEGEQEGAINVAKLIIGKAISKTFKRYFPDPSKRNDDEPSIYEPIGMHFELGNEITLGDTLDDDAYSKVLLSVRGLKQAVETTIQDALSHTDKLAWMDILLETLHQHSMLGKVEFDQSLRYTDMLGSMFNPLDIDEEYDEDS